jgi:TonB family protein
MPKKLRSPLNIACVLGFWFAASWVRATDEKPVPDAPRKWFTQAEVDEIPRAIQQPEAEFPYEMRVAGLEGQVLVAFHIDESGAVIDAQAVQSNNPWYERPAVVAVLKWRFTPAKKEGKPVPYFTSVPIVFGFHEGGQPPWEIKKAKNHAKLPEEFRWDEPPKAIATRFPVYPFELLRKGAKEKSVVSIIIDPNGGVAHARVVESTVPEFGQAVAAMFEAWRFEPAKQNGRPCYAGLTMEHIFDPKSGRDAPIPEGAREILDKLAQGGSPSIPATDLDEKPAIRRRVMPVFPGALRGEKSDGEAVIEFFIDRNGDVQLPRVISATKEEFGWAAAQAVSTWRFLPPRKDGKPVVTKLRAPITFKAQK